ncbi:MAG: hypothetical protein WC829_05870 [Hyphomicrobium sp.]|jgi:hypothetical protein
MNDFLTGLVRDWRDAREAIFKAGMPSSEMWRRLGAAEYQLMLYARNFIDKPSTTDGDKTT